MDEPSQLSIAASPPAWWRLVCQFIQQLPLATLKADIQESRILNTGELEVWLSLSTPEESKMGFLQQFPLRPSLPIGPLQPRDSTNTWTNHFCFPTQPHPVPARCPLNSRSSFAASTPPDFTLSVLRADSLFSMAWGHTAAPLQPRGWQGPSLWPKLDTSGRYPPGHLHQLHQLVVTTTSSIRSPRRELTHQFHSYLGRSHNARAGTQSP